MRCCLGKPPSPFARAETTDPLSLNSKHDTSSITLQAFEDAQAARGRLEWSQRRCHSCTAAAGSVGWQPRGGVQKGPASCAATTPNTCRGVVQSGPYKSLISGYFARISRRRFACGSCCRVWVRRTGVGRRRGRREWSAYMQHRLPSCRQRRVVRFVALFTVSQLAANRLPQSECNGVRQRARTNSTRMGAGAADWRWRRRKQEESRGGELGRHESKRARATARLRF